jgi:hypothetical protein
VTVILDLLVLQDSREIVANLVFQDFLASKDKRESGVEMEKKVLLDCQVLKDLQA